MSQAKLPLLALCAALLANGAATAEPFAISNLRYGPMCGEPDWQVCEQTSDVAIDGRGQCVFDHKEITCTWYGFSFDYTPKEAVKIDCDMASDFTGDVGNPNEVLQKDATSRHYSGIPLSGGRFVSPQYMEFKAFPGIQHLTESCSYQGSKLFEFTLNLHYEGPKS